MSGLSDYVKDIGRYTLAEKEFTTEDALVLSEFCYLKYDGLIPEVTEDAPSPELQDGLITLEALNSHPDKENLFQDKRYEKDNRALYVAMVESRRFAGLRLGYYINKIDVENGTQFSAVTYIFPDDTVMVVFRGTDETMVGWEEDFSMALKKPIPGQTLSVEYLEGISKHFPGSFMVGGHSKGGNLAVFSAMCANKECKEKISKVYSFDGPGFRPEFLEANNYDEIKDRVVKIIPRSSPVGLMLDTVGSYTVIESKSVGALQHNPYNWIIKKGSLVETSLTDQHKIMMKATNEFLLGLTDEELPKFVSILCWILDSTKADTTIEFQEDMATHTKELLMAGQKVDDEMKEVAASFVRSYFTLAGETMKADVHERYNMFVEGIRKKSEEVSTAMTEAVEEAKEKAEETKVKAIEKAEETKVKAEAKAEEISQNVNDAFNEALTKYEEKVHSSRKIRKTAKKENDGQ